MSSSMSEREVARNLAERPEIEPPPDLLERIKAEIPPELPAIRLAPPEGTLPFERRAAPPARRLWLMAASLVAMVGAALFSLRVMEQLAPPAQEMAETAPAKAPEAPELSDLRYVGGAPPAAAPRAQAPADLPAETPAAAPEERAGESTRALDAAREADAGAAAPGGSADEKLAQGGRSGAVEDRIVVRRLEAPARIPATPAIPAPETQPVAPPPPPRPEAKDLRANADQAQERRRDDRQWMSEFSEAAPSAALRKQKAGDLAGKAAGAQEKVAGADGKAAGVEGGVVGGTAGAKTDDREVYAEKISVTAETPPPANQVSIGSSVSAAAPSTGGTAEPNGEAQGHMFFRSAGVNPFVDAEEDPLSTFGLDVDTASYTVARRYLDDGHLPPPESVRVEEFVNFFHYGDRAPERGDFALRAEGAPTPFADGERYRLLRFSIRAREVSRRDRKPAVLTFVVDVSGSMDRENRLGTVKQALGLLVDQLGAGDKVGLVIYGSRGEVVLEPTADHAVIRRALARLVPGGSTNAEEGLRLGYEMAGRAFRFGGLNRVILCSDGVANVASTGADEILARIGREARRGIELTTVGFGMGNYNDVLMEKLADAGDGRYAYVDTLAEARRIFAEDLTSMLQTVARDAKVQVEFDPRAVARYRLLGYENRDIADRRFRDDTVDAGEIGAGHQVTALYEVKLQPDARPAMPLATLHLRYRSVETGRVEEVAKPLRVGDLARSFEQASPALRLAAVTAEFAEILRGSYWAKEASLADVLRRSRELAASLGGTTEGPRVRELADLVLRATQLGGVRARVREE
jgi:Ca-activated chloride channel homolog